MFPLRKLLVIVALLVGATASVVHFTPGECAHVAIRTPVTRDSRVEPSPPFVLPDLTGYLMHLQRQHDTELLDGIAEFAAFLDSLRVVTPIPAVVPYTQQVTGVPAGGGGLITQEQYAALNQCEASGENGWRTGRYGIEAGYPIGHLSDAEQQAWVQQIYDAHGAGAWGVACRSAFN